MELKTRILAKLDEINQYREELEQYIPGEEEEYLENQQVRRACEKTVELAIEAVISIISMIVSHQQLGLPKSEDDLINILDKKKIISSKLAATLKEMKGFRNILVHRYTEVDDQRVYRTLSEEIEDFAGFEKEIRKYLQSVK
ncbi:MAG: DUF86 domain-containing protein [Nanoarchaeota archaeon]